MKWKKNTPLYTFFENISFTLLILIINFPLAFAVCNDAQQVSIRYTYILCGIPLVYGLTLLLQPRTKFITCLLFGTLIGYLIYLICWGITFNNMLFNFLIEGGGVRFLNYGLIAPILPSILFFKKIKWDKLNWLNIAVQLSIIFLVFLFLCLDIYSWNEKKDIISHALIGFIIGLLIALITYFFVNNYLLRRLRVFNKIVAYIKAMGKPMLAFFAGYFVILFFFAGIFSIINASYPHAFNQLPHDKLIDLFYYSLSSLTGLGASTVQPQIPLAIFISGLETFIGITWVTMVFAATIGYLQDAFSKVSLKFREEEKKMK
jgi:hypothetical protein